jgi:DNA-binding NarL/FixJ family response regulator
MNGPDGFSYDDDHAAGRPLGPTVGDDVIRVVLVDTQELVRTGVAMLLDAQEDMRVVGQAPDTRGALRLLDARPADVVLVDVPTMRPVHLQGVKEILDRHQGRVKVVMLSSVDSARLALVAIRAGVSGFLLKQVPAEQVLAGIRAVHRGDLALAPSTTRRLVERLTDDLPGVRPVPDPIDQLTAREREVLVEVATGASNAEIAERLDLAEATVKSHVRRMLAKLHLRDRVQAVVLAYELRLVRPQPTVCWEVPDGLS